MKFFSALALAALAACASAAPADAPKKNFTLDAEVSKGEPVFGGRLLVPFHTGAGQNAVVSTTRPRNAALFYFYNGHFINTEGSGSGSFPAGLTLGTGTPYNSSAPKDFKEMEINGGLGTGGFSFNKTSGLVSFTPPEKFEDWETFVMCHVNQIAYDPAAGPQYQLLWRAKGSKGVYGLKCADVDLYADI